MTVLLHPAHRKDLFSKGQDLFNQEQFFEAHEAWEELWLQESGRDKTFLQGLIQVAGHFVHIAKGNASGAQSLALAAQEKLRIPPVNSLYASLDIEPIRSTLQYNLDLLASEEPIPAPTRFLIPKLF